MGNYVVLEDGRGAYGLNLNLHLHLAYSLLIMATTIVFSAVLVPIVLVQDFTLKDPTFQKDGKSPAL
jgi:hypothetical protein